MNGCYAGAILYLLSARCTGSRYDDRHPVLLRMHRFSDTWKQYHFSYFQRCFIMFPLVSERTCHATAPTWNDVDFGIPQKMQYFCRLANPDKGFLMAMAVQPYFYKDFLKVIRRDMPLPYFR